jgi:hypothetical protein
MGVGSSCKLLLRMPNGFDVETNVEGKLKNGTDDTYVRPLGKVVTVSSAGGVVLSTLPALMTGVHSLSSRFNVSSMST